MSSSKNRKTQKFSYDSIAAAAAGMSVPAHVLKAAKSAGSPGFRGSRVYPAELSVWLDANPGKLKTGDEKRTLEVELLLQKCRRAKTLADADEGLYMLRTSVESWVAGAAQKIKAVLAQKLTGELPPKLEGLRAVEIAQVMDAVLPEVLAALREKFA